MVKEPSKSVAPCEEFFLLVVETHVVAAAMQLFEMSSLDDTPCTTLFPDGCADLTSLERRRLLMVALRELVEHFVDIKAIFKEAVAAQSQSNADRVRAYACEVLSLGLLLMEYNDGIREADGVRILRCWRYFLPIFKASNRTNYSVEAFTLLAQHKYLFSPRMAQQLQWSRTVNVHGRPGKNIPADLHMEHLNRLCKDAISGLGANITEHSIERVGRCLGRLKSILCQYDSVNRVPQVSGSHTKHSVTADMQRLLTQLMESDVFQKKPDRFHKSFPNFASNFIKQVSREKLLQWMHDRMNKLIMYH